MRVNISRDWLCRNAANAITLFGIFLNQVIKWLIFAHTECTSVITCVAVGDVATDWIDGQVARYFEKKGYVGSISDFGKAADRFRDKDFQLTMLLFLIWHPMVDPRLKLFLYPLVVAEIILIVTLFKAIKKKKDASATNWGKWKMSLECAVILAGLATILAKQHGMHVPPYITYPVIGAAITAAFFAVMSIKGHIRDCCD